MLQLELEIFKTNFHFVNTKKKALVLFVSVRLLNCPCLYLSGLTSWHGLFQKKSPHQLSPAPLRFFHPRSFPSTMLWQVFV